MKFLILFIILFSQPLFATCMLERTECIPGNEFQNRYEIVKVSCSAPGGPVRRTETLNIYNRLSSEFPKALVSRELNTTRHLFLQAEIKIEADQYFLKIDDRKFLSEGDFHISTTNADFMLLEGYNCKHYFH